MNDLMPVGWLFPFIFPIGRWSWINNPFCLLTETYETESSVLPEILSYLIGGDMTQPGVKNTATCLELLQMPEYGLKHLLNHIGCITVLQTRTATPRVHNRTVEGAQPFPSLWFLIACSLQ